MRAFRVLAVGTAVVTYIQIVLGGVVRVSGSGLGCPDWPLCHGRLLPPLQLHPIIEYSHRSVGFLASLLILLTAIFALAAFRRRRDLTVPAGLGLALLGVQVILGGITVLLALPPPIVLAHLAVALAVLAATCVTAVHALVPGPAPDSDGRSRRFSRMAVLATYFLVLSGSLVVGTGASLACDSWPLCAGGLGLSLDRLPLIQEVHRVIAALVGGVLIWCFLVVLRRLPYRSIRALTAFTLTALAIQVAVGAAIVTLRLPASLRGLHLALATAVWTGAVLLSVLAHRLTGLPAEVTGAGSLARRPPRPAREVMLDYLSLAKPRIILLLLITALGGMMIAARGWPSTGLVLLTLLGGALSAAGAGAINCWIDRDVDAEMLRTRRRPIPDGRIAPAHALTFGIGLGVLAFLLLAFWVNVLAATLAASGLLFYVFVYTLWLKRSTPQNIVIGGAAGAVPPLVGWAAVTHGIDLTALTLFAVIFFWTPPHFWALALRLKPDYARARIPMLPVVAGDQAAKRQILWYTLILLALTLALFATRVLGLIYFGGALLLGLVFAGLALLNLLDHRRRWLRPLFDYSIAYLALLFAVMVIDRMVKT